MIVQKFYRSEDNAKVEAVRWLGVEPTEFRRWAHSHGRMDDLEITWGGERWVLRVLQADGRRVGVLHGSYVMIDADQKLTVVGATNFRTGWAEIPQS